MQTVCAHWRYGALKTETMLNSVQPGSELERNGAYDVSRFRWKSADVDTARRDPAAISRWNGLVIAL
jgi:hypothetical protein